ncbi:MAG: IS1182 family transposase [Bacteroidota bacterium]|jgi:transposase
MSKVTSKAVFKEYNQQQIQLLPPSLDDLVPCQHLVRVVNEVVESLDLSSIVNQYEGGGASAYHPKMMTKVMLYGYAMKIYTGRKLAKALQQDVTFMWLAANNRPDFRTLNLFRSGILKETIEELFQKLLLFLVDHGYIKVENYFTDGTTLSADANKHKVVWRKNAERYKTLAEEKCRELFKQIDALNQAEDAHYGDRNLEEMGSKQIAKEDIKAQVEKLNQVIENTDEKRKKRKAVSVKKKLAEQGEKIGKYEDQLQISGSRSGYSKTDTQATAMRMKNEELLPAYNILASSEDQFITAVSVHQNPNDATCFKEHVNQFVFQPETITADSIFGTEENYELLEGKLIDSYLKYPSFHREQSRKHKENPYLKENFSYDAQTDSYQCPTGKKLNYTYTRKETNKKTGYVTHHKIYQAQDCSGCPLREVCTKSKENNRTVAVNIKLDVYRKLAAENLHSEKGKNLRNRRGYEIESCFGDIKHNMGFRRFHLRGLQKVKAEIAIVSMAHNLRKIHLQQGKQAA